MPRLPLAILIIALATSAFGQSSRRHHKPKAAPPQPSMPSAKQSEEMKKLTDTFAGMWKTTATIEKNAMFPLSGTSEGRSDIRSGPAGNSLIERSRSHGVMGVFAGLGVFWWDSKLAAYKGLWCDSLAPDGCDDLGAGKWEGNNLVFTAKIVMNGNTMMMRNSYTNITTDSYTYTMEAAMGDAPMAKMMAIQYERVQPKTTTVSSATAEQQQ